MSDGLHIHRADGVAVLALDRPDRRNSMDIAVTRALAAALYDTADDPKVNCVLLKGRSHGFGAGSDLKALASQSIGDMVRDEREMGALARSFNRHPKPIVAAVDGYAVGGGAVYAASCDVVFSSRTAKWALPEVAIGWNAAYGIAALQARLGPFAARHVLWGVEGFDGVAAHRMGLCDFIAEDDAESAALAYARRLAEMPVHAVKAVKALASGVAGRDGEHMDNLAMSAFADCLDTPIAQDTLRRFGMKVS